MKLNSPRQQGSRGLVASRVPGRLAVVDHVARLAEQVGHLAVQHLEALQLVDVRRRGQLDEVVGPRGRSSRAISLDLVRIISRKRFRRCGAGRRTLGEASTSRTRKRTDGGHVLCTSAEIAGLSGEE